MGLKNSRPLPLANAELEMAPFFKRRFRTWHLDHIALVMERYRALTMRHCIDAIQLSAILGIKDQTIVQEIMRLFQPKTPTRVHHMVDAMEIVVALILVCQAPSMKMRFDAIFDVIDLNAQGTITPADLVMLFGAFARTVMKLFRYAVESDQRAAMLYINTVLESGIASSGSIEKHALSKLMLTDQYAVHYTRQCTGEAKHKLYFLLEKETQFLGAIEFHTEAQMKSASLQTIREMAVAQLYQLPSDFTFLCQGREVQRVWEVDRKGWSIVPFAMRGSPGLRVHATARNRRTECPRRTNAFEFRYMGNTLARYKKKVSAISPVYKHRGFKIAASHDQKPLACVVKWRVAENWSGEWVYDQPQLAAATKSLLQKRLRNAPRATAERVAVKTHRGELISPWASDSVDQVVMQSRPGTSADDPAMVNVPQVPAYLSLNSPAAIAQRRQDKLNRASKIKWKSRVIAMDALQRLDVTESDLASDGSVVDKENEPRRANRTQSVDRLSSTKPSMPAPKGTTVLIHVQEGRGSEPSRLLQQKRSTSIATDGGAPSASLRVHVLHQKLELRTPSTLSNGGIALGPFVVSSNIELEEDEVEVFPVIVIRPHGDLVEITTAPSECDKERDMVSETPIDPDAKTERAAKLWADPSFLSEYEFEISRTESNFERIYHHIHATSTDLVSLNRRDVCGRTLLHDAAEHGHSNLMELLLKQRVLRNVGDWRGDTPLHHAARRARLKEVSALLREGAAPWQLNNEGKSPLFVALEAAARRMRQSAVSHKRPPAMRWNTTTSTPEENKNFLASSDKHPKMRQVIDLLWDRYPSSVLTQRNYCDRTNCLVLEQQVFGDLFQACRDANLLRVKRLIDLEKRATAQYINEQLDTLGRTILHEAAEQGHTAVVNLLLKVGADGYIQDQRQQLPLHIAAEKGHERIAKCLIHAFPGTLLIQDCMGKTALHLAMERDRDSIAMALIAAIKDVATSPQSFDLQDARGYTALHYGVVHGNVALCRALVDAGAAPNVSCFATTFEDGDKPYALSFFYEQSRRGLKRTSQDQIVWSDMDSPAELLLRSAKQTQVRAYQDRLEILRLLVPLSASSTSSSAASTNDMKNQRMKLAPQALFHLAVEVAAHNVSFAVDVCKTLSELKYEVNLVHPKTFDSALLQECKRVCVHRALYSSDSDPSELALLRTLIQVGANVNLPNAHTGETPLACASWYGHVAMLDLLLDAGAECNSFPRNSFSSLHFAALGGNVSCARLLLGHKANVNVHALTPKQNEAPLFFAIRSKSEAMVSLLLDRGADPCAVCTLQHDVIASFGIDLSLQTSRQKRAIDKKNKSKAKALGMQRMPTFGPGKDLIDDGAVTIASPLTFTLLVARGFHAFGSQVETNGVARAQKRHDWEALHHIALLVAQRAIATTTPSGSAGSRLITRNDVYLACVLGYWDLAKLLLAQQVMLSNAPTSSKMNALHLAAAAGQTSVVIALVAAGVNVNCRIDDHESRSIHWSLERSVAPGERQTVVGARHRGALYFALVHGHVETAAKLFVLGARPLDTLPHVMIQSHVMGSTEADTTPRQQYVRLCVHESMPKQIKDVFFAGSRRHRVSESPTGQAAAYHHDRVACNFVTHLACSLNARIPLLHYAAGMGYTSLVRLLVEAGMSMTTQLQPSAAMVMTETVLAASACRPEWRSDTAIHVAIACGHLDVVRFFASQAQFNFPRHFLREGTTQPESLLVTASLAKRVDILRYLLSTGLATDDGGGFNIHDTRDDLERALNCCAREHFVDGFMVLLEERTRPDLLTLVMVLENINWNDKRQRRAGGRSKSIDEGLLPPDSSLLCKMPRLLSRTRDKRRLFSDATVLIDAIAQHHHRATNFESFFTVLSFDHLLTVMIVGSQYQLWRVFHEFLVTNETKFMEPLNPWRPLLVRAASCCMVLHRAAKANEDDVVRFFLRLGVPADLRLSEFPALPCPIRLAAESGSLRTFLTLALRSSNVVEALGLRQRLPQIHFRTIASSTSWSTTASTSPATCRWQNMSAMSCYEIPIARGDAHFVQKIVQLLALEMKSPMGNTLLHLASARGDPVLVQLLLTAAERCGVAGDLLFAENAQRVTPLMAAASRKDAFGVSIVRVLVASLATAMQHLTHDLDKQTRLLSRALVACYAQPTPCNLKTAKVLLAAGADVHFEDETDQSAMRCALRSVQFAAAKLLLDNGAILSLSLVESFLSQFQVHADNLKTHWRTFASYLKSHGQRLLEVESLMTLLLEKKYAQQQQPHGCLNENVVHQMLTMAAAIAATTAKQSAQESKFWAICSRIVDQHAAAIASRKTVWGHRSALHYAVQSLEIGLVEQLVGVCAFDVDAEDESKQTPLHLVAMNGDAAICRLLLHKLTDKRRVDCVDLHGRTPLHLAVIHGHEANVKQLVLAGGRSSLEMRCRRGLNAHLYAATLNHVAILMALFDADSSRSLLFSESGEFAVFLAARSAAFRVVRWFETVYESMDDSMTDSPSTSHMAFYELACRRHDRTLLHYAAMYGDHDLVARILLTLSISKATVVNKRDNTGYTALMYAFAFGKLDVVELLLRAGADPDVQVDHSGEAKTHPYACGFSIATFRQWVALPGWFSYLATHYTPQDKRILTQSFLTEEHYLLASGYHRCPRGRKQRPPVAVVGRFSRLPLATTQQQNVVRSTLRSWRFPQTSLFEFACQIGDHNLIDLLSRLPLPGLLLSTSSSSTTITTSSAYTALRRAFLAAVQWNRLEIVTLLLSDKATAIVVAASVPSATATHTQTSALFADFLETAVDRAVSRGLEQMTILLLSHWHGIKENGRRGADANAFAFQFAHVFQVACIRKMMHVVQYMITRGGDQIVGFHWNDAPSLGYAFAFGHVELASLLLQHGAHISTMDTYVAPSFKKWIEFGCPAQVQVQWYELSAAREARQHREAHENREELSGFVGPLEVYDTPHERLDAQMMAELFLPEATCTSTTATDDDEVEDVDVATADDITVTVD